MLLTAIDTKERWFRSWHFYYQQLTRKNGGFEVCIFINCNWHEKTVVSELAFLLTAIDTENGGFGVGIFINSNCHEKTVFSELAFVLTAIDTKNGGFGVGIVINSKLKGEERTQTDKQPARALSPPAHIFLC